MGCPLDPRNPHEMTWQNCLATSTYRRSLGYSERDGCLAYGKKYSYRPLCLAEHSGFLLGAPATFVVVLSSPQALSVAPKIKGSHGG
jgi:hypothetical protein